MILPKYIKQFWSRVDKTSDPNGCWFRGPRTRYSQFGPEYNRMYSHRFAYTITHGPIPEGLFVCHTCDNRGCVNPDHLWLGTNKDNMRDMVNKGRSNRGMRNGQARLSDMDILWIRDNQSLGVKFLSEKFNISRRYVYNVIRRERRTDI